MDKYNNDLMIQRQKNIDSVKMEIFYKNNIDPYIVDNSIYNVQNDMDVFPYPRWFQGIPTNDKPIVSEREAGWRPINPECYYPEYYRNEKLKHHDIKTPRNYFQPPCSTTYPKYVNENDISFSDIKLNENCVISYR